MRSNQPPTGVGRAAADRLAHRRGAGDGPDWRRAAGQRHTATAPSGTAQLQPAAQPSPRRTRRGRFAKPSRGPTGSTAARTSGGAATKFKSRGYDCSGAVSYVLHAAGILRSPMASGPLMSWGSPGIGQWITVYANKTHAWMHGRGAPVRHLVGRRVPEPGLGPPFGGSTCVPVPATQHALPRSQPPGGRPARPPLLPPRQTAPLLSRAARCAAPFSCIDQAGAAIAGVESRDRACSHEQPVARLQTFFHVW